MTDTILLRLNNIQKSYQNIQALNGVSLELKAGQMMALLGHNGAGKTTLMKIILGMFPADTGDALILGDQPGVHNHAIGYVPENVNFYPTLTGKETLLYFAQLNGLSKKEANTIAEKLLIDVRLDDAKDRAVKQYSKGMKQRLGLAQALLPATADGKNYVDPSLLILDEPTVGLDPIATAEFYELLANLQLKGCGVIICTHVLPGIEAYIDTALILDHGKAIASGTMSELQSIAELPVTLVASTTGGALEFNDDLAPYQSAENTLRVPINKKLEVLKTLLNHPNVTDIQVNAPMLPEIYQHFAQAGNAHVE
ncbi:ABC transporter ATP-binding protein [Reinekea sp.]|jgi:Cu-processing system ATP-binding protein|uniref:ABC transporter ATP-binding protein n=1 Tax=Reinekea sp. TaxID=1970455 RepID=UPI003989DF37